MHKFPLPLSVGEDPATGNSVLGFTVNNFFIFDPAVSECGRFEVDSQATYGLSGTDAKQLAELNDKLEQATQAALDAGCRTIQDALGVATGDVAGMHFAGREAEPVRRALAHYMALEVNLARK